MFKTLHGQITAGMQFCRPFYFYSYLFSLLVGTTCWLPWEFSTGVIFFYGLSRRNCPLDTPCWTPLTRRQFWLPARFFIFRSALLHIVSFMFQRQRGPRSSVTGRCLFFFFPSFFLFLLLRRRSFCCSHGAALLLASAASGSAGSRWLRRVEGRRWLLYSAKNVKRKRGRLFQKKKKKMTRRFSLPGCWKIMIAKWRMCDNSEGCFFFFLEPRLSIAFAIDNFLEFSEVSIWIGGRKRKWKCEKIKPSTLILKWKA